ncbi:hypothetical protein BCV70DRAFT_1056 [Testicularia cyperi]|uniref:Uncharacterized protein n=1 Tax=Testicularia cyperi TaxID=1882483 RepID=A0A317XX33_9BASI|nr:hypothetical protein BCV70DRAFT_1056 [Testicularia cyperi]
MDCSSCILLFLPGSSSCNTMSHLIDEERRQEVLKRIDEVVFQIASQLLDRADQIDRYERMADEAPRRPNAKVEPVRVTVSATTERDDDLANTVGKGAGKPSLPTLQFPTRAISGVQRFGMSQDLSGRCCSKIVVHPRKVAWRDVYNSSVSSSLGAGSA